MCGSCGPGLNQASEEEMLDDSGIPQKALKAPQRAVTHGFHFSRSMIPNAKQWTVPLTKRPPEERNEKMFTSKIKKNPVCSGSLWSLLRRRRRVVTKWHPVCLCSHLTDPALSCKKRLDPHHLPPLPTRICLPTMGQWVVPPPLLTAASMPWSFSWLNHNVRFILLNIQEFIKPVLLCLFASLSQLYEMFFWLCSFCVKRSSKGRFRIFCLILRKCERNRKKKKSWHHSGVVTWASKAACSIKDEWDTCS